MFDNVVGIFCSVFQISLGVPVSQFKMQEVLPQQIEAIKAYLDRHVQKAT